MGQFCIVADRGMVNAENVREGLRKELESPLKDTDTAYR